MKTTVALAHLSDSREDFREIRTPLVDEEIHSMQWISEEYSVIELGIIHNDDQITEFLDQITRGRADSLIIHLPIWADPIFSLKLANLSKLPTILVGNQRPETSSMVGLLGAGGSLDQIGYTHFRVFDQHTEEGMKRIQAFIRAAGAVSHLRGQTLGLFGGPSLGIFTAGADPVLWQQLFGLNIEYVDQLEIQNQAERMDPDKVKTIFDWLTKQVKQVTYNQRFTVEKLEKQVRSYLATIRIAREKKFDFVGVKCQPEMSDGYVSQCVSHMLMNSTLDPSGSKEVMVHACESDADAALTMQVMHLISGSPAALLDLRLFNPKDGNLVVTNCGAIPPCFCATLDDPTGLQAMSIEAHVFGKEGGGALPAIATPRKVTLARFCRLNGEYWMAIIPGEIIQPDNGELSAITPAFPKGLIKTNLESEFLNEYSSNHIHMVEGDIIEELSIFCDLLDIPSKKFN